MGISIRVAVDPECISRAAWTRVFDETVTVLQRWPEPPIRPVRREIAGVEAIVYARDVIGLEGWHICGDATSRLLAESIELPREFGSETPTAASSDLLLRILATYQPPYDPGGLRWLLGNKTQGKPFHLLVLAVAMLIEHRLPGNAFVDGDFTLDEARRAQSQLRVILGEEVALPLSTQPAVLADRIRAHVEESELEESVRALCCRGSLAGILIGLLDGSLGSPGSHNRQEIEQAVACTDVSTLDPLTREAFEFLVGQAKSLFGEPAADPSEPVAFPADLCALDSARLLPLIARGSVTSRLRLTEMAWHDIERAEVAELRLLALLAVHPTSGLIAYQLRRAVFESVAIRRFCLRAWSTTDPVVPRDYPVQARLFDESRPG